MINDLRNSFLNFFKERDHKIIPSSSLVPKEDPTLLFTTAGMVQFKPMFAGSVKLEYRRAASVQKCFRTSDLENVGKTKRHCTFFEMLGNFSFGDYFKKEAIRWAWDYSTDTLSFSKDDIWVSIYLDDDEAFEIWHKDIGVSENKIIRLGKEDNFWGPAGESGACGPCSELYLDRGAEYGCSSPDCKPGCDCERFLEYWNLVFNQYNQDVNGKLNPLPQTGIDTGMGLERLATLVQNVDSIYETDELYSLVKYICNESSLKYENDNITPINIIVEHSRALCFAISDGAYPSNEGRGYVLRRLLRRALRFTRMIGITEPFIHKIVDPIVEIMGECYPELRKTSSNVKSVIQGEEKRFLETLEIGMERLSEIIDELKQKQKKQISGKDAFVLYDTYGFPLEMTVEIASESDLEVDMSGFEIEMNIQKERGKQSWKGSDAGHEKFFESLSVKAGETEFTGYDENITESDILLIGKDEDIVDCLCEKETGIIITKATSFYGEAGGQVGDRGIIKSSGGNVFKVTDTKRVNNTIIHEGEVQSGEFKTNDMVQTEIENIERNLTRANHTATHLLQAALRKTLGDHVHQAGSRVEPDRLRFDFTHFNPMSREEIEEVESLVNHKIWESLAVNTEIMTLDKATETEALAVFDEKYEDIVRVVGIADYSKELCGGTHVDNTGKIGIFKILREASPGAGVRRIEAVTLKGLWTKNKAQENILHKLSKELNVPESDIPYKVESIINRLNNLEKEIKKQKRESLVCEVDSMIEKAVITNGIKVISHQFEGIDTDEMRRLSDIIRSKEQDSLVCFGSKVNNKALLLFAATNNAVKKGVDCGKMLKQVAKIVGGGGGGRKDMAQAGGNNPETIGKALEEAVKLASNI
ncbi:MAG: alanine--tRNA ligase [Spirochaetota bacterium]|nr:alanine--tRNA ligase [Spirochaetota bacterium]